MQAPRIVLSLAGEGPVPRTWSSTCHLRIGRLPELEIALDDMSVNRIHAEIHLSDEGWVVRDRGSSNGTVLNGVRIGRTPQPVHEGDTIQIGGPKNSSVLSSDIRRWLLVGDETALPAIGRRIEEAPAGTSITSIVAVSGPQDHQAFKTAANLTTHWAHRPLAAASDPTALLEIIKTIDLKPETFAWVAAEAHVARAIRSWLIEERSHPKPWLKAGGYWVVGKADAHDRLDY